MASPDVYAFDTALRYAAYASWYLGSRWHISLIIWVFTSLKVRFASFTSGTSLTLDSMTSKSSVSTSDLALALRSATSFFRSSTCLTRSGRYTFFPMISLEKKS